MEKHLNFKDRTGEKHITNQGYEIEIIECFGKDNCTIRFPDGNIYKNRCYGDIKRGKVRNPFHPSFQGIGYMGIGKYNSVCNKEAYQSWNSLLQRCYDSNFHERSFTYKDCSVSDNWKNFQVFAEWHEKNYIVGFALDKDILVKGNKVYSSETCCFVPKQINQLFVKCDRARGQYPIGVYAHKDKFIFNCTRGKDKIRGRFNTPEEAFQAYKIEKEKYIKEVADKWRGKIAESTYQAMVNYKIEITD